MSHETEAERKARLERMRGCIGLDFPPEAIRELFAELERVTAERDEFNRLSFQLNARIGELEKAARWAAEHTEQLEKNWDRLVDKARAERDEALAANAELRKALDAIWGYEEAVQRDLKARGDVSDGTMYRLLQAKDLRDAALARAPKTGGES